ncbi:MAG: apolipoprotein N-acyltransferase [Planctomycetaceae bacterium]|nr:apolipoprotein N-acyltransferase [Planctomycetaceae bacterium]
MAGHRNSNTMAGSAVTAPPQIFQPRLKLRRRLSVAALAFLTPALMVLSQPPLDAWYVAYIAMVPWLMAIVPGRQGRWQVLCATLAGLLFWLVNVHWLSWITPAGYLAGAAYLSLYWLVAALLLRAAMRRGMAMWIVLPIVWTAVEYLRAHVIEFPWFLIGQTQYRQARLIQIADITGQYGLTFFVAMVNGALLDLLNSPLFVRKGPGVAAVHRSILTGAIVSAVVLAVLLGYGTWRLNQSTTSPGPVLGVVQEAFPIALEKRTASAERIFEQHINRTRELEGAGCDLVIWPETMLPVGLNPEFERMLRQVQTMAAELNYPDKAAEYGRKLAKLRDYRQRIAEASKAVGCAILAGGASEVEDKIHRDAEPVLHNSAMWFDRSPEVSQRYDKMHLVPFGEAVPFEWWPWLHETLQSFVPQEMSQLQPGGEAHVFTLNRGDRSWNIISPICFEGTLAEACRQMVMPQGRKIPNLVMANLSNDGWFVYQQYAGEVNASVTSAKAPWVTASVEGNDDVKIGTLLQVHRGSLYVAAVTVTGRQGRTLTTKIVEAVRAPAPGDRLSRTIAVHASTEQSQHLAHYFFRAVENRVPIVRAVNTGISAAIDSNGRLLGEVRGTDGKATMVCGTMVFGPAGAGKKDPTGGGEILVDNRVSVYSRFGDVFAWAVCLAGAGLAAWLAWKRPRRSQEITG